MSTTSHYDINGSSRPRAEETVLVRSLYKDFGRIGALIWVEPQQAILLCDAMHLAERVAPSPRRGAR